MAGASSFAFRKLFLLPSSVGVNTQKYYRLCLSAVWLTWALTAALHRIIRAFPAPGAEINSDAYWTYLPNAKKFLDHPWTFLTTDPSSYHVAPLSYIWVALWGADPVTVQVANCVLFLLCVLMMWRTAILLGGLVAGVISTSLLVYSPEIYTFVTRVLSESIYLFGLLLFLWASCEYLLSDRRRLTWLALASAGLTITLLSRPVLQVLALVFSAFSVTLFLYLKHSRSGPFLARANWTRVFNKSMCLALLCALVLPAMVVVKNGIYFNTWGLGTGAGSGLYYGINPFKMGLEPIYSGFNYDAGAIPMAADPQTRGNPLSSQADDINKQVAIELIKQTSIKDNFIFFAKKMEAWLLYSTPELRISPKLRVFRLLEWLVVFTALSSLWWRHGTLTFGTFSKSKTAIRLPGVVGREPEKLGFMLLLLLVTFAMALQLAPVLYNMRYNIFFMEPWLMLLCGCGAGILMQTAHPWRLGSETTPHSSAASWMRHTAAKTCVIIVMALVPIALGRYSELYETWSMDPYRPGPTAVVLDRSDMGEIVGHEATALGENRWRLDASVATLALPLRLSDAGRLSQNRIMDAIWRIRLAVDSQDASRHCSKLMLQVTNSHPLDKWYEPDLSVSLQLDAKMHTYAFSGNGRLRPAGNGDFLLTLSCPIGTVVTWSGAELLESTLAHAARDFVQNGVPIDPYRYSEPR